MVKSFFPGDKNILNKALIIFSSFKKTTVF